MRVLLFHNPTAGEGQPTGVALVRAFEGHGHSVVYHSTQDDDWKSLLGTSVDAVVAAGGDGTVRKIALGLADRPGHELAPLVVLPIGTANNIGRTLGITGDFTEVVAGLAGAASSQLSIGTARGPWGSAHFVESAGVGIFAAMLGAVDTDKRKSLSLDERYQDGVNRLSQALESARPRHLLVDADGEDLTDEYLMVEAMNIASIGPWLDLAPGADYTGDGMELVLVKVEDRPLFHSYIESLRVSSAAIVPLPSRRVRQLRLTWPAELGHLDDQVWPDLTGAADSEVSLQIDTVLPVLLAGAS